ncbi:hypothetical protein ACSLNM_22990, partial [Escherichia coli]
MDLSLLKALSEADAIASSEQEVRQILLEEADRLQKEVRFDGLGSVLTRLNKAANMLCTAISNPTGEADFLHLLWRFDLPQHIRR